MLLIFYNIFIFTTIYIYFDRNLNSLSNDFFLFHMIQADLDAVVLVYLAKKRSLILFVYIERDGKQVELEEPFFETTVTFKKNRIFEDQQTINKKFI